MEKRYTQEEAEDIRQSARAVTIALNTLVRKLGLTDTAGFIQPTYTDTKFSDMYHDFLKWENCLLALNPQGRYKTSTTIKL